MLRDKKIKFEQSQTKTVWNEDFKNVCEIVRKAEQLSIKKCKKREINQQYIQSVLNIMWEVWYRMSTFVLKKYWLINSVGIILYESLKSKMKIFLCKLSKHVNV